MKIIDQTNRKIKQKYSKLIKDLYRYFSKKLNFDEDVREIRFIDWKEESEKTLGKTAFYAPSEKTICVIANDRYIKDMLRSLSHELIHHKQNLEGEIGILEKGDTEAGYAQKDDNLRKLEKEAYQKGNMMFRDFEDQRKIKSDIVAEKMKNKFGFEFRPGRTEYA